MRLIGPLATKPGPPVALYLRQPKSANLCFSPTRSATARKLSAPFHFPDFIDPDFLDAGAITSPLAKRKIEIAQEDGEGDAEREGGRDSGGVVAKNGKHLTADLRTASHKSITAHGAIIYEPGTPGVRRRDRF